jgi:hypothetical protein
VQCCAAGTRAGIQKFSPTDWLFVRSVNGKLPPAAFADRTGCLQRHGQEEYRRQTAAEADEGSVRAMRRSERCTETHSTRAGVPLRLAAPLLPLLVAATAPCANMSP